MTQLAQTGPTAEADWRYRQTPTTIEVQGSSVALRRHGAGAPVLFLHGVGLLRQWLPFHAALAESVDLVAPDHPGFADTPLPSGFTDFTDYVLHYDAVIRQLGLTNPHLVGHGLGARLAAHLATVYPDRFASLTLLAPSGLRVGEEPLIDLFRMSPADTQAAMFNGREAQYREVLDLRGFPEDDLDAYADSTAHALLTWTNRFDRLLAARLGRLTVPTLVLAPDVDRIGGTAAQAYADLIPGAQLESLPGPDAEPSSYAQLVEQPAEVAARILAHVAAHRGTTSGV